MALIQCTINKDAATGNATVTYSVQSIGPGDKITFVTDTPGTAIHCRGCSPFEDPSVGDLYNVPMKSANPEPILVAKSIDDPKVCQWECGEVNGDGYFVAWPGAGPVFPHVGSD